MRVFFKLYNDLYASIPNYLFVFLLYLYVCVCVCVLLAHAMVINTLDSSFSIFSISNP